MFCKTTTTRDFRRAGPARRRAQRGSILLMTLTFLLAGLLVGISIFTLAGTSSRLAERARQKSEATELAYAGVHALYAQVSQYMSANTSTSAYVGPSAVPSSGSAPTLSSTVGGITTADGTYAASLTNPAPSPVFSNLTYDKHGNVTGGTSTYTFTAKGTGTAANGVISTVYATFIVRGSQTPASSGGTPFTFPTGAMVSNGNILLQGSSRTTDQSGNHGASALANGVISHKGASYAVDGTLAAAPLSYSATAAAMGSSPNDYGGTVTQLAAPITFPNSATIASWQDTWTQEAKEATTPYPSGHLLSSYSGAGTLTAPCYISGDLNVSGALTVNADTSAAHPALPYTSAPPVYVLYVHGNVTFANGNSSLLNNGVLIVADGTISIGKNSTYSVGNYSSSTSYKSAAGTSLKNQPMYETSGLDSFSSSSNAITMGGNANANVGFVYAINGGTTVAAAATLTGSLISGASGTLGGITLQAGSLIYPQGFNTNYAGLPPANQSAVTSSYTAGALSNWVQTL